MNHVAIFGISPQSAENGRQLRERTLRDARIDQAAHKAHDAFWQDLKGALPFWLISDPDCSLARKVGAERENHWHGPMVWATTFIVSADGIVRWSFQSKMASRRPSPIKLAEMAGAVAKGRPVPEYIED